MPLSQADFNRMIDDHGPALYGTACRMVGDRHEAEDLVQETFRSVWKSRFLYEPRRSEHRHSGPRHSEKRQNEQRYGERAWLLSILRRRVADRWRKRKLPAVLPGEFSSDVAAEAEDPLADEFTDEMQHALGRLPKELRETLLLVVVGELTHQEAADELGVPIGTVLSRVSRARDRLRKFLLASTEAR